MNARKITGTVIALLWIGGLTAAENVFIQIDCPTTPRVRYAAQRLESALRQGGHEVQDERAGADVVIILQKDAGLSKPEHFRLLRTDGGDLRIGGSDDSGLLYGCLELGERLAADGRLPRTLEVTDGPAFTLRGPCIGMQKMRLLKEYGEYNYPYTPELFPFFYDQAHWIDLLDRLTDNRMNTLYLWNGHPFSSLVKLEDYPEAMDVSEEVFEQNRRIFHFLTTEADKRGIWVVQKFYNIHISRNLAEAHGLPTLIDKPSPLLADYTRKSIAEFVKQYPHVGLLVCLGEALLEDKDVWFRDVIIAGVQDGMKAAGLKEEPPIILREHTMDDDAHLILQAGRERYSNLYTMMKYNGESLTTERPRGPWAQLHRRLSAMSPNHISNVHILANLEPFRYGATRFIQQCTQAQRDIHRCNGLHLFPLAYWDWPIAPDKARIRQIDRDWIWFDAWARYAWNPDREPEGEDAYWQARLARCYGCSEETAALILEAYNRSGECGPKLLRRMGITNGNRQTLSLGMTLDQFVRPEKHRLWPRLVDSDCPPGERLHEYVENEWKGQPHSGETPVQVIEETLDASAAAVRALEAADPGVTKNRAEFDRLLNDMRCIRAMSEFYAFKACAAMAVLRYGYSLSREDLETARDRLEKSVDAYRTLAGLTEPAYRYANSLQTGTRQVPFRGADGAYSHWTQCLPVYEQECRNFAEKIARAEGKDIDWLMTGLIDTD